MKKCLLLLCLAMVLSGCGSQAETNTPSSDELPPIISQNNPMGDTVNLPTNFPPKDFSSLEPVQVDHDLSIMNATLSFAQASRMLTEFDEYMGDTVKIKGHYAIVPIADYDITVHLIMLLDELMCCQGFLEFRLPEGADYPQEGEEIMIVGTYIMYQDAMGQFPVIEVSQIV